MPQILWLSFTIACGYARAAITLCTLEQIAGETFHHVKQLHSGKEWPSDAARTANRLKHPSFRHGMGQGV